MKIKTTVELIPTKQDIKDKDHWLVCWRVKKSIDKINEISRLFATGNLYCDESFNSRGKR